jgi:hypothetical protein
MQNDQSAESAEIWRAAQHRRTEDLAEWLSPLLKRAEEMPDANVAQRPLKPRFALARGLAIAVITVAAITSVFLP